MKIEKKDSKRWILLALLVLILLLLLGFCSRNRTETVPAGPTQQSGQLLPTTGQSEENQQVTTGSSSPSSNSQVQEPTGLPCRFEHRFSPFRIGAYWVYQSYTEGREGGYFNRVEWVDHDVWYKMLQVSKLTSDEGVVLYTFGWDDPPENIEDGWNGGSITYHCPTTGLYDPLGLAFLPYDLRPGNTWSNRPQEHRTETYQANDLSSVTVQAGTFDVLCIEVSSSYDELPQADEYSMVGDAVGCYAEGVGLVYTQWEWIRPQDNDVETTTQELMGYYIPPE